jgi:diacylglycerol kinase family enzyme
VAQPVDILPPEANQVLISANPKAGRSAALDRAGQLAELLEKHGFAVDLSTDLGEICKRANRLHAEGRLRALVGVGGDGTAAELVNRTDPGVPITFLAAGTANLISKHFHLGHSPERIRDTIVAGRVLKLDAGSASGRLFLIMVGCGFDADVVRQVHASRERHAAKRGRFGYLNYLGPLLRSIRGYQYPEILVYWDVSGQSAADAWSEPLAARWAFVFNLPCYGWGLPLAPEAVGTDGLLDLCSFVGGSLASGLRYLLAAEFGGRHQRMADCRIRRAHRFRITAEEAVPYQLDGDFGGYLPLDVEVLPERVTLVVPPPKVERGK